MFIIKFIVIEGLDGSGKTTQANKLYEYYNNHYDKVVLRAHPNSDNKYGQKSKEALLKTGKFNHFKATLYFGLDAIRSIRLYAHRDDIDVLIFSRYILAVAYLPDLISVLIYKIVYTILPVSENMFFLDLSPEESLKRLNNRGEEVEMFENREALIIARRKAHKVLDKWHVIDGTKHQDIITTEIIKTIEE